jgi:hypothetical protein
MKAATAILRLAQLPAGSLGIGPTDAEEIVRLIVAEQRKQAPEPLDELVDNGKGLPPFAQHMEDTWRELEARAAEADAPAP